MPETPDFNRIAHRIHFEATGATLTLEADTAWIVEELRLVWNARGAADITQIEHALEGETVVGDLTRAIQSLDR